MLDEEVTAINNLVVLSKVKVWFSCKRHIDNTDTQNMNTQAQTTTMKSPAKINCIFNQQVEFFGRHGKL